MKSPIAGIARSGFSIPQPEGAARPPVTPHKEGKHRPPSHPVLKRDAARQAARAIPLFRAKHHPFMRAAEVAYQRSAPTPGDRSQGKQLGRRASSGSGE